MRERFHQFFAPTESDFREMWASGLFSFDANVLLNIYRYSDETKESLINFIVSQAERIRLPHQFALEFVRNRPKVIVGQSIKYDSAFKIFEKFENEIGSRREHPHLTEAAQAAMTTLKSELIENRKKLEGLISSDNYANTLDDALSTKIGSEPKQEAWDKMCVEAAERFKNSVPPGFADAKDKTPPDCYGDYIAWNQLIAICSEEKRDLILVTDDTKEDWWRIENGRTIGPRPELLAEFRQISGRRIWLYQSERFLQSAREYLNVEFDDRVIEEVGARLSQSREDEEAKLMKPALPEFDPIDEEKTALSPADKPKVQTNKEDF